MDSTYGTVNPSCRPDTDATPNGYNFGVQEDGATLIPGPTDPKEKGASFQKKREAPEVKNLLSGQNVHWPCGP